MKKTLNAISRKIKNSTNRYFLRGDKVHCELCGWDGQRFPKSRCPKCKSLARTRLIPFSIQHFNLSLKNKKILHVAPNVSEYEYIKSNFKTEIYDRLDIVSRKTVNLVQDLTNTTIENEKYDLIIIWHVLEHIPEDLKAISEMFRVLRKDGKLLVSVPIYPAGNEKTLEDENINRKDYKEIHGHSDHCRSCGLDYYQRFEKIGFKTSTLHTIEINESERKKYGISSSHTSWLFTKV